jgi:plasmid replication initiation protein
MAEDTERKQRQPLLPLHHPEPDFFICDIFDAVPKSDTASMEHPLFSLSTKPDFTPREYQNGEKIVKLSPSPIGLATVHDRDVLIFCISKCMARLNAGKKVEKTLRFNAHDLLRSTNRATNDQGYKLFKNALRRLQGTQVETNITTGGREIYDLFSFIESARTIKESREGRMQAIEITLSDWVFNAIQEKGAEILTISRDYFRLRKPLERRLYELARKCCGQNSKWQFRVQTLHERTGSTSTLKEFRRMLKNIIEANNKHAHIPDYTFILDGETVVIRPRREFKDIFTEAESPTQIDQIRLKSSTHEVARKFADGYDLYGFLEPEWRSMLHDKKSMPENPDGSFVAYVKWYVSEHGPAR